MSFDRKPVPSVASSQPPQYGAQSPPPMTEHQQPAELQHTERSYTASPPPMQAVYAYPAQQQHQQQFYQAQSSPFSHYGSPSEAPQQGGYFQPSNAYQQQPSSNVGIVMPLASVQASPAPVQCPNCTQRTTTSTTHVIGNTTHAWGAGICLCFGLGFIPYLMSSLKDVEHRCPKGGVHLATWHKSGRTDVKMHG